LRRVSDESSGWPAARASTWAARRLFHRTKDLVNQGPQGQRRRGADRRHPDLPDPLVIIPVANSSWILGFLAKIMPLTYSIDLARNIFYAGKPEYAAAVVHPLWLDLAVTIGLFVVFIVVGTFLFVRSGRNR
jgi:hypothetical protein